MGEGRQVFGRQGELKACGDGSKLEGMVMLARREFFAVAAGATALVGGAHSAAAALYPERPIRLVLPFPPGGVFDIIGRPWADKVKASLGSVFVDNQSGAGGSLAAQLVAHAAPDGYTIFLGGSTIHLTEMILREHPLLDPMKELTAVSIVAVNYYAIVVNPTVPVHSLQELVSYVRANPGKLAYGSAGTGTVNHLTGELFKSLTGLTDLPHVAYRGAGPAIADAIGAQIPIIVPAMTNQVLEFHRTGKFRLLAITSPNRIPVAPEISTAIEGGVPDLVTQQVMALFAPAGTPKPIIAQIDEANHRAMADAAYRQSLVDAAVIPLPDWTAAQFDEFMRTEIARWTPLVKAIGVRLD
jgi:tripartite-type tricarboxylate transporter receptor subunit TctC